MVSDCTGEIKRQRMPGIGKLERSGWGEIFLNLLITSIISAY
jgi:hypothetical protein